MKAFKKRLIPTLVVGVLSIAAAGQQAFAQTTETPAPDAGIAQPATPPAINLSNKTGILWLGGAMNAYLKPFQGADNVQWTLYVKNEGSTTSDGFDQVDQQSMNISLQYPVSTFATQDKKEYKLVATYMKGDIALATAAPSSFKVMEMPVVSNPDIRTVIKAGDATQTEPVSFELTSNDIAGRVLVSFGDKIEPVVAVRTSSITNVYTANVPVPTSPGLYQLRVKVEQSLGVVSSPVTKFSTAVVTGPKIAATLPKPLDTTGEGVSGTISIRAVDGFPKSVMQTTLIDPTTKKPVSVYKAEWLVPGSTAPLTQALEAPFSVAVSATKYAELLAQANADGKKTVTYPVTVKVYHPDYPNEISSTQTIDVKLAAPWAMPEWSLTSKGNATVVAPSTVVLDAVASSVFDQAASKTHKLKYEWSVPVSGLKNYKATGTKLTLNIDKSGPYPVEFAATDDLGNRKTAIYNINAVDPTLTVTDLATRVSPTSARNPVSVAMKVATASTHLKERPASYEVFVDGTSVFTGPSLKPIIINTPGDHAVKVAVTSNYGTIAEKATAVSVVANNLPVCKPFKASFDKNRTTGVVKAVAITADCADTDGRVKSYEWTVGGAPVNVTLNRVSYQFPDCVNSVDAQVQVIDDSGERTTYSETIQRGGVASCPGI